MPANWRAFSARGPLFSLYRVAQMAIDLAVNGLALIAAYAIASGGLGAAELASLTLLVPVMAAIRALARLLLGVHQQLWRYVSLRELIELALATAVGSIALACTATALAHPLPLAVIALDAAFGLFGCTAARTLRRLVAERRPEPSAPSQGTQRVLIVGAGKMGSMLAREICKVNREITLVGLVDDCRRKLHSRIHGVSVLGTTADIAALALRHRIDEVILAMPSAPRPVVRRIVERCREAPVKVRVAPGLQDLIAGKLEMASLREVDIEDLLGRDPVAFDRDAAMGYLAGRVVMVTGAGGSIGSELCRQIAQLGPSRLVLLGRGEFSIYTIELELRERFPNLDLVPVIADIRDPVRMGRVFELHTPEVVFHAAAHKHVPLMEKNPSEAVFNNVLGTRIVAELADRHHAETFVLISSDKAVNPTNVMGASKRLAEMVVQELATRSATRFMSVRFGNVLGSRGSVIPLFKRQIAEGGPITITHPDIIRYFMTIPEASQLVLQAGALGQGGEVFVLDMGAPVKIVDLARDLITLSGLEPEVDIKIKFTGLRPGEKLYEELLTAEEGTSSTEHKKIFIARPDPVDRDRLDNGLGRLVAAAASGDDTGIRRGLKGLVSGYKPPEEGVQERKIERRSA